MKHCCKSLEQQFKPCTQHGNDCPDYFIKYFDRLGEYTASAENADYLIQYCPWCGTKFPDSFRDRWFDELTKMGFDNPYHHPQWDKIPEEYKDSRWRNK